MLGRRKARLPMPTQTTMNSAQAWSPDETVFAARDAIPGALLFQATNVVIETLAGDAPVARIPYVDDTSADFVLEGENIPQDDPELSEITVPTRAVAKLIKISLDQWRQQQTSNILSESTQRAITKAANAALLTTTPTGSNPLRGLLETEGILTGESISTHLDPLAELVGQVEDNYGNADVILCSGATWAAVRKLKVGSDRNDSLVGAGVESGDRRLLGIPVLTTPSVPAGQLVVIDRNAIPSAISGIQIDTSEHLFFDSYSLALRAHWRFGWRVQHANRLGIVPVTMTAE